SPISALIEPMLAAQPPFISRSATRSVIRPSRPTTRSKRTISLARACFSATIALNSAAIARITSGWLAGGSLWPFLPLLPFFSALRFRPLLPFLPFGGAGSKRRRTEKSPSRGGPHPVHKGPGGPALQPDRPH